MPIAYHPRLEYLLVALIGAAVAYLTTPLARRVAVSWRAVARPRDRDVHAVATPRMGGVALFAGLCAAIFVAGRLPTLRSSFSTGPDFPWIVVAAALICLLGIVDDRFELDSITKLAGQVAATGVMVTLGGVQLSDIYLPWGNGTVSLGPDLGIPVTILLTVLTINAVNFVDGLDGLAAGVTAISAAAFFAFSFHLAESGFLQLAAVPTLLTAALAGTCVGFLPHNFFPARVFMGDSGSMLVGLILSAAATTAGTGSDPQTFQNAFGSLPLGLPLIIPLAILVVPFVDLLLAVIRRVRRGASPFAPDKKHLHHRLLELGHSHRRAVLLLYFWTALVAFGGVAFAVFHGPWVLVVIVVLAALVGTLASVVPRLRKAREPASSSLSAL